MILGNRVTTVHTIDQDNDIITYSIEAAKFRDGSKYFRIDEKTGDIFVKESLKGQVSLPLLLFSQITRKSLSLFIINVWVNFVWETC